MWGGGTDSIENEGFRKKLYCNPLSFEYPNRDELQPNTLKPCSLQLYCLIFVSKKLPISLGLKYTRLMSIGKSPRLAMTIDLRTIFPFSDVPEKTSVGLPILCLMSS